MTIVVGGDGVEQFEHALPLVHRLAVCSSRRGGSGRLFSVGQRSTERTIEQPLTARRSPDAAWR